MSQDCRCKAALKRSFEHLVGVAHACVVTDLSCPAVGQEPRAIGLVTGATYRLGPPGVRRSAMGARRRMLHRQRLARVTSQQRPGDLGVARVLGLLLRDESKACRGAGERATLRAGLDTNVLTVTIQGPRPC